MNDQEVMLAALAYDNGLVTRPQLLQAFGDWVRDRSTGIGQRLIAAQAISLQQLQSLESIARGLVALYPQRADAALARISGFQEVRDELQRIAGENHPELFQS